MSEDKMGSGDDTLPNYQNAEIPPDKLRKYALDPNSAAGKHKARVFKNVLGFDLDNWELLRQSILEGLPNNTAELTKEDLYGKRYNVRLKITGPNGNTAAVLTAWIIRPGTDYPRLTTVYVEKRER